MFIVMGLASLIWFLIRVIPKPSRVAYPCMKAAAPLASSFVMYILGLTSFTFVMKKAKQKINKSKYLVAIPFMFIGLVIGIFALYNYSQNARLNAQPLQEEQPANEPIGIGKGIFSGRVVWIHNPNATNEDCTNEENDYWSMDKNTNQDTISKMLSQGLQLLTGKTTNANAWDAIFKYYNQVHGKGEIGYSPGEKIVIKINLNGLRGPENINTSPQIAYAILDQLVNIVGVDESDIHIGDPNCPMGDVTYSKLNGDFPDINYWGNESGMVEPQHSDEHVFKTSDGEVSNYLPQSYIEAEYMINIPVFKKHHRAGISIAAKNHFGSIAPFTGGAWHLHYSLPCPEATSVAENGEYGVYRCFVDIMGHKHLGGKTILYLVDGIWGSVNWGHPPVKWAMTPFNNDWPSSLFLSQDPVAIESVCYDFLFKEFNEGHPTEGEFVGDDKGPYPQFPATDDYLHQAADPTKWASDIQYDPEDDGTVLSSLGTHEHWNNSTDKQYSWNLGNESGIELVTLKYTGRTETTPIETGYDIFHANYPNPFVDKTTIKYQIQNTTNVQISIYNMNGKLMRYADMGRQIEGIHEYNWNAISNNGYGLPNGVYIYKIKFTSASKSFEVSNKMMLLK